MSLTVADVASILAFLQTRSENTFVDNTQQRVYTPHFVNVKVINHANRHTKSPTVVQRRGPRLQPRRRGYNHN